MKVYLGADHRGFKLKEELKTWLLENDIAGEDLGADKLNPNDDYPIFAEKVARSVSADLEKNLKSRGIVMCGSESALILLQINFTMSDLDWQSVKAN